MKRLLMLPPANEKARADVVATNRTASDLLEMSLWGDDDVAVVAVSSSAAAARENSVIVAIPSSSTAVLSCVFHAVFLLRLL
mmetsp:Transcript_32873/g.70983  ORF Transcript_32873/g.70983 Transcript_32873/m.70983 type:complete len:82 (+) Transcript_32873:1637-1882(+)